MAFQRNIWMDSIFAIVSIVAFVSGQGDFITQPQHVTKMVGHQVTFDCAVAEDMARAPIVIWQNGSSFLSFGYDMLDASNNRVRILGQEGGMKRWQLQIDDIQLYDQGEYSCKLNTVPEAQYQRNTLTVQERPSIEINPIDPTTEDGTYEMREGESRIISCDVIKGTPEPQVKWLKMGAYRVNTNDYGVILELPGSELILNDVSADDAGTYQCVADNKVGPPATMTAKVMVHYPPSVDVNRKQRQVKPRDPVNIDCVASASPAPEVYWFHNGRELFFEDENGPFEKADLGTAADSNPDPNSHTFRLTIKSVEASTLGEYACEVENSEGRDEAVAKILGLPQQTEITSNPMSPYGDTYPLEYKASSKSPFLLFNLQLRGINVNGSENTGDWVNITIPATSSGPQSHWLSDLSPNSQYEIRLQAVNGFGAGPFSDIFTFSTGEMDRPDVGKRSSASFLYPSVLLVVAIAMRTFC
ncbi:unnamed protein product [Owenia fusiformis]|uniref:Uncharacterized protein n=1 Tax=Owenia fusiformis TaxID=6347 RepID=A0A8J1TX67_OWEFU|nr:unnamed protein product [Owenia fusiformis]